MFISWLEFLKVNDCPPSCNWWEKKGTFLDYNYTTVLMNVYQKEECWFIWNFNLKYFMCSTVGWIRDKVNFYFAIKQGNVFIWLIFMTNHIFQLQNPCFKFNLIYSLSSFWPLIFFSCYVFSSPRPQIFKQAKLLL